MGRKALIAVLCWISLSGTSAKAYGVGVIDNVSAESASRLYRNVPVGVYASANPYASYSFHVPQFAAPTTNQIAPLKEQRILAQSTNNFLKDSYGQRFVEAPQAYAYKAALPQQFVPLQNLPAHLSQPLVAAAPNVQYGQATHFFGSAPYRLASLQGFSPDHVNTFGVSQPLIYAGNIRTLAASPALKPQINGQLVAQQQSPSNKNVYINTLTADHYNKLWKEPKIQTIREEPKISASDHKEKQQRIVQKLSLVNAPKETAIPTTVNGKKTFVNLITKPPVPLLDLTLLEPLSFNNPLVPQVQHFLPRIHQVTYKKLPEVNEVKKQKRVFMLQNTKTYEGEVVKTKPKSKSKKKQKKQPPKNDEVEVYDTPTAEESPIDNPEFSYEVNSPNYKETYSEKKVSYNKQTQSEPVNISYEKKTQMKPVHYSYEKHTAKMPVHYSYVHSSKEPAQLKQSHNLNNNENPKHLIYHFKPEENNNQQREQRHKIAPHSELEEDSDDNLNENDTEEAHPQQQQQQPQQRRPVAQLELVEEAPIETHSQPKQREEVFYQNSKEELEPEHREETYSQNPKEISIEVHHEPPKPTAHKSSPAQAEKQFQAIVPEYDEDITVLPTHKPHPHVHADANHDRESNNKHKSHSVPQNEQAHYKYPKTYYSSPPATEEKSKRITIKEESPQEVYTPNDELMAAMVKKQEESEEDFEKAYKDAAYGFPAYDTPSRDVEKEIYNPGSYGISQYNNDFDVEKSALRQYEAPGDVYPSYTRSNYKDARDKTNEEYYSDYAVSRPESLADRHKKKADYFNNYKEHAPQKYFAKEDSDKQQTTQYVVSPSYSYHAAPQQKQLAKYTAIPKWEEYSYAKEAPLDSSAFASRPLHIYSGRTQYLEPHYQYGFEPGKMSHFLDSELAAMASNDSPESEKPGGTRKKIYKENFYIKKSSTAKGVKVTS